MRFQEVHPERTLLVELAFDESLSGELLSLAEAADLDTAWVLGTGALRDAELGIYDQDDYALETVQYDEPLEMPLFAATLATAGEAPFVQVQAVLARPSGQALAGRVTDATVFGGEALVWGFEESIPRETDAATGMDRFSQ